MKIQKTILAGLLLSGMIDNQIKSIDVSDKAVDLVLGVVGTACLYYIVSFFCKDTSFDEIDRPESIKSAVKLPIELEPRKQNQVHLPCKVASFGLCSQSLPRSCSKQSDLQLSVADIGYRLQESMDVAIEAPYI